MSTHQVTFLNALDLAQSIKPGSNNQSSCNAENNLPFVYEISRKRVNNEIDFDDETRIFNNHNIDLSDATEFYYSQRMKGKPDAHEKNVYELLTSYVKRHPDIDYYIDELPILQSRKSK